MRRIALSFLIVFTGSIVLASSVSMFTTWLVDKDRTSQADILDMKSYGGASLSDSGCTRYYFLSVATQTYSECASLEIYSWDEKITRLQDEWTAGNGVVRVVYDYPVDYRDYSVKVTTP